MIYESKFTKYKSKIEALSDTTSLEKKDLLKKEFLIASEDELEIYYAAHNEFIHTKANVLIVGITPGWNQMKIAYESVIKSLLLNKEKEELLRQAKVDAGFSGQMRLNLCHMLDEIGLAELFDLNSSTELFTTNHELLHTTSLIKYPTFYKGKNYTGHVPSIENSNLLSHYAYSAFPRELEKLENPLLIIPLGKAVEKVIRKLKDENKIKQHTCLYGFPHPSGANGHRKKQLSDNKEELREVIVKFDTKINRE